ncbi:DUF817 domain-containing protein [Cognatishimia sp. WU-CL00825]|uniref:DUF817 domain-containing protein n=1 Tax=Cognatishimia sp. WU-CL00825 TaxID=3127658 RepID=UPI003108FCA0
MTTTQDIERRIGDWMRAHLPAALMEFIVFWIKQAWASIYSIILLFGIYFSSQIWQADWAVARYDALVIWAVGWQIIMLVFKLETFQEAKVILLFHLIATVMEVFKVNAGSWHYPEEGYLKLLNVPLFSGFMYASVGSYLARVIRLFDMRFTQYPPFWMTLLLASAIYINFFTHHFLPDLRWILFVATLLVFFRTRILFRIGQKFYGWPLPAAALLSSLFMWLAENVGTISATWLYRGQTPDQWVSLAKLGSWYLLLYVSFVSVTLVTRDVMQRRAAEPV